MPEEYDWVDVFESAQSDGTLPLEKRAKAVRYKRGFIWEVDLLGFGIGGKSAKGGWEVTFTAPDGRILFHSVVESEMFLVSLSVPGLNLFTWNYVKDVFKTDVADGKAVDETTIGEYLSGGTAQSEQGDLQPASGQDSTNLTATIISDWFSPVYLFPSGIPKGTKVTIKRDTWGFGPSSVEYGWAFDDAGSPAFALRDSRTGETWILYQREKYLHCAVNRRSENFTLRDTDPIIKESSAALLQGIRDGADLYAIIGLGDTIEICVSRDEGENWEEVPMAEVKIEMLAAGRAESGAIVIYGKSPVAFTDTKTQEEVSVGDVVSTVLRVSNGEFKAQPLAKVAGANPPDANIIGLIEDAGSLLLVAQNEDVVRVLRSTDQLKTVSELTPA